MGKKKPTTTTTTTDNIATTTTNTPTTTTDQQQQKQQKRKRKQGAGAIERRKLNRNEKFADERAKVKAMKAAKLSANMAKKSTSTTTTTVTDQAADSNVDMAIDTEGNGTGDLGEKTNNAKVEGSKEGGKGNDKKMKNKKEGNVDQEAGFKQQHQNQQKQQKQQQQPKQKQENNPLNMANGSNGDDQRGEKRKNVTTEGSNETTAIVANVAKQPSEAGPVAKKIKLNDAKLDKLKSALLKTKMTTAKTLSSKATTATTSSPQSKKPSSTPSTTTATTNKQNQPAPNSKKGAKQPSNASTSTPATLTDLQAKMKAKLSGGRFRMINEKLYTTPSDEAVKLFKEEPETFQIYHDGFRAQVESWPSNPVDHYIQTLPTLLHSNPQKTPIIIADMGCGEAKLSESLESLNTNPQKKNFIIHSFDLASPNDRVVACDIRNVPLKDGIVDVCVFCLALMGVNFLEFLAEANRITKKGGLLKIAEVVSRFPDVNKFIKAVEGLGYKFLSKDASNKMFILFEFKKVSNVPDNPLLTPCIYKKR
ncbi:25S rRNA (adenine645-N1)-methyltransferase [Blyttiomyces sp. JEL0837]|nr:25S rRNA (adenine645-N1)-methyltransferase [Blyttiomyces sp. JEL0837]